MNYLNSIFWDYPQFTEKSNLKKNLAQNRDKKIYLWFMTRFLEYGRVVDSLKFFKFNDIIKYLPKLNLTSYTLKKWKRLIEVYGRSHRK